MQQLDLFEETLEKKILRMERWMMRLHKELIFLKEVHTRTRVHQKQTVQKIEQMNMFGT